MENLDTTRFTAEEELAATSNMSKMEINCLLLVYYKFVKVNGPTAKKMSNKKGS